MDIMKILAALLGGAMSSGGGNDILKSVLESVIAGQARGGQSRGGPSLEDILGGGQGVNGGGLGDILGGVLGGSGNGPDLGDILGGVLGGGSPTARSGNTDTGIGDIIADAKGSASRDAASGGSDSLEDLIGAALKEFGMAGQSSQFNSPADRFASHSPDLDFDRVTREAEVLVRAMVNAAVSDGRLDGEEKEKILGSMGELSREEVDFLNQAIANPQDGAQFAKSVPASMAGQAYTMSLTAIDLDTNPEARYLHELAQGMGLSPDTVNGIHRQLGAPEIYG